MYAKYELTGRKRRAFCFVGFNFYFDNQENYFEQLWNKSTVRFFLSSSFFYEELTIA